MNRYQGLCLSFCCMAVVTGWSQPDIQERWQQQWTQVQNGNQITLPEGTFHFTEPLSFDGKKDVQIKGAGMGKTILSFAGQTAESAAIRITNSENIRMEGFTILDPNGDGIKTKDVWNIQFLFIEVKRSDGHTPDRTGSGLHPVECQRVLLYECRANGLSVAGLHVEQCEQVVIRKCHAEGNGVGVQILNSLYADVVENIVSGNTCGVLLWDLPGPGRLPGGEIKVYKNQVLENNREPVAGEVHPGSDVPPGSGIIVRAMHDVRIYENMIVNNRTAGTAILSHDIARSPANSPKYDPYPSRIYVYDNTFSREKKKPVSGHEFCRLVGRKFGRNVPHILYDGRRDETFVSPTTGRLLPEHEICIYGNSEETFADLSRKTHSKNQRTNLELFRCK